MGWKLCCDVRSKNNLTSFESYTTVNQLLEIAGIATVKGTELVPAWESGMVWWDGSGAGGWQNGKTVVCVRWLCITEAKSEMVSAGSGAGGGQKGEVLGWDMVIKATHFQVIQGEEVGSGAGGGLDKCALLLGEGVRNGAS
eukprot:15339103-Ditylum_brightwellii.AAC.1